MVNTHRTLDGSWAACSDTDCQLPFHVELSPAEAERLPLGALLPLLEVVDPPTDISSEGMKFWFQDGNAHRDYDLPALIYADGYLCWYQDGLPHRSGGKPAMIAPDGSVEYWVHGAQVTQEGKRI